MRFRCATSARPLVIHNPDFYALSLLFQSHTITVSHHLSCLCCPFPPAHAHTLEPPATRIALGVPTLLLQVPMHSAAKVRYDNAVCLRGLYTSFLATATCYTVGFFDTCGTVPLSWVRPLPYHVSMHLHYSVPGSAPMSPFSLVLIALRAASCY